MSCGKTFRIKNGKRVKQLRSTEKWLKDRSTLRRIEERTGESHMAHWKRAQAYSACIPSPLEHCNQFIEKASSILILDGTFTKVLGEERCIHIAYDTKLGVIDYWIDDTENKTAYAYMLARLKAVGYEMICAVSDGNISLLSLLDEEKIPHQRCIFHVLLDLRIMLTVHGELSGSNRILYSRLKRILKSHTLEKLVQRIDDFRKMTAPIFQTSKQISVILWFWKIIADATLHLSFEPHQVPRTSNLLENLNGQIKARLKTFRGVKSEESLNNLLKILFRFRNYK